MDSSFSRQNPNMDRPLFDWPVVLQYDVKAKYRFIFRKLSGMKFFHPNHARLYLLDKPIKSLYFSSFVVFVLFARFHFKVIRKSLKPPLSFVCLPVSKLCGVNTGLR